MTELERCIRAIVAEEIRRQTQSSEALPSLTKAPVTSTEWPDVMSADQVAAFLGLDRKTVYDYASRGVIPNRRVGSRRLFSRPGIMAWLEGEPTRKPAK